jgi:hypothetical protein
VYGASIGSPLLFVRGDVRAKSNRSFMERRSGAPYFLYAVMCVLKLIEVVWSIDREPLAFCTRWFADRVIGSKPLTSIGNAYFYLDKAS